MSAFSEQPSVVDMDVFALIVSYYSQCTVYAQVFYYC